MREHRRELVRLSRVAVDRPPWQLALAVLVSVWSLAWVVGQPFGAPGPLDVVDRALTWAGVPTGWLAHVGAWCAGRTGWLAVVGGLLWAMTRARQQLSALLGWLAVMLAAESVGYGAVHRALLTFAVFAAVLGVVSIPGRRAFVVDRIAIIPKDVGRAAATALALSAVVPLIAPGLVIAGLLKPYVTRPPRSRSEPKERRGPASSGPALPTPRGGLPAAGPTGPRQPAG
ncbi:hypothetical protein [Saccharothrix algeriensis]|uniref:Uncharacterized protein n=1 Tax=Saccharothrix algeriensis TaxID=173560 RepID=A0A8T8I217_9PSEU|nr:hypothetical protein [Saccharothrix algeriensis]MBM7810844.1 hypothetical protein [Saccharothrix algeriensis]QTR04872.1 hypothetical protein J7S33_08870 [Saccharothrix algeriensis]